MSTDRTGDRADLKALLYRPEIRQVAYQVALLAAVAFAAVWVVNNVSENLRRQNIASGFDFLGRTSGFDVAQSLIEYSNLSTYGRAFWVGLLNTLLVAALGIVAATMLGFVIGIARLSSNWLVARLAGAYVEIVRNVPLLLQLFFWYFAVLKGLPSPRQSYTLGDALRGMANFEVLGFHPLAPLFQPAFWLCLAAFLAGVAATVALRRWARRRRAPTGERFPVLWQSLALVVGLPLAAFFGAGPLPSEFNLEGGIAFFNVRGLYLPAPVARPGFGLVVGALAAGIVAVVALRWWGRRRQELTGQRFPLLWPSLALIVGLPAAVFFAAGSPLALDYPELRGFNFQGGIAVLPELIALWLGLSIYTASFIAEIVRAGILGVPKGQTEAAQALGLSRGLTLRLVVIPQATRIIIPPLTSQYLNLTKNSSLAVAIGYPDFVSITGTVLNQTGQAVEVILMTMGVYLAISLLTSLFMNWFNRRMALVER